MWVENWCVSFLKHGLKLRLRDITNSVQPHVYFLDVIVVVVIVVVDRGGGLGSIESIYSRQWN